MLRLTHSIFIICLWNSLDSTHLWCFKLFNVLFIEMVSQFHLLAISNWLFHCLIWFSLLAKSVAHFWFVWKEWWD